MLSTNSAIRPLSLQLIEFPNNVIDQIGNQLPPPDAVHLAALNKGLYKTLNANLRFRKKCLEGEITKSSNQTVSSWPAQKLAQLTQQIDSFPADASELAYQLLRRPVILSQQQATNLFNKISDFQPHFRDIENQFAIRIEAIMERHPILVMADRLDGLGEREKVLIGEKLCAASTSLTSMRQLDLLRKLAGLASTLPTDSKIFLASKIH